MLILSRKKNESIVINDDITVTVVEIRGDKVRLGVEAPPDVPVHRREVYEAIRRTPPGLGGHGESGKPKEYMDSIYSNPSNLCPNSDSDFYDSKLNKLERLYNF